MHPVCRADSSTCQKELFRPKWRNSSVPDATMKTMSAREAKNAFGLMIDTARAEPVLIEKHGRGVVMVISVEDYDRLYGNSNAAPSPTGNAVSERVVNRGRTERA
jgi:prevent-host-death family protein